MCTGLCIIDFFFNTSFQKLSAKNDVISHGPPSFSRAPCCGSQAPPLQQAHPACPAAAQCSSSRHRSSGAELTGQRARRTGAAAPSSAVHRRAASWLKENTFRPQRTRRGCSESFLSVLEKGNSLTAKFGSTVAAGGEEEGGGCSCNPTQSAEPPATEAGDARRARTSAQQQQQR